MHRDNNNHNSPSVPLPTRLLNPHSPHNTAQPRIPPSLSLLIIPSLLLRPVLRKLVRSAPNLRRLIFLLARLDTRCLAPCLHSRNDRLVSIVVGEIIELYVVIAPERFSFRI